MDDKPLFESGPSLEEGQTLKIHDRLPAGDDGLLFSMRVDQDLIDEGGLSEHSRSITLLEWDDVRKLRDFLTEELKRAKKRWKQQGLVL
jgi:hypothetical protein